MHSGDRAAAAGRNEDAREQLDVIVIGAGQAGLAIGYYLARQGRRFAILEAADAVGSAWRTRWDSLVLFTARRYDALPGLAFPGDPDGHPTRDEVIAYLETYASTFALPVQLGSPVRSLAVSDGRFVAELDGRAVEAAQVVVATGPFQVPNVPAVAGDLAPELYQVHSTGYTRPSDLPDGTVVVVGGGNTGYQIAKELSSSHDVHLAIGSRQKALPQRFLGRDLFWWLTKTAVFVFSGLVLWGFFSAGLTAVSQSLVENRDLVTKTYFPALVVPVAVVLPGLADLGVSLVMLGVVMAVYGVAPGAAVLLLPVWIVLCVLVVLGAGLPLSALNVRYRDVRHTMTFIVQVWLFASPVAYSSSLVEGGWRYVYALNPMVSVLDGFRWSSVGGPRPGPELFVSLAVIVVGLAAGLLMFLRAERQFADLI